MKAELIVILLFGLLILDILYAVTRASLVNAHLPRLLNMRVEHENAVDLTIQRMERPRVRVSLRIAHLLCMAVLVFVFLSFWVVNYPAFFLSTGWMVLVTLGFGILVALLESILDGYVLRDPEGWAIRMSGFAAFTDFCISPISAIAIRLMNQSEASSATDFCTYR